jgi:hypothetical protein
MDIVAIAKALPLIAFILTASMAFGYFCGYPVAHWLSQKLADLLSCLPTEQFETPRPRLGVPASLAVRGELDAAAAAYEELLESHPAEKEIHFRLLELVLGPMRRADYGEQVLERGMENLIHEADRAAFFKLYGEMHSGVYKPMKHLNRPQGMIAHTQLKAGCLVKT